MLFKGTRTTYHIGKPESKYNWSSLRMIQPDLVNHRFIPESPAFFLNYTFDRNSKLTRVLKDSLGN